MFSVVFPASASASTDATRTIPEALPLIFELNAGQTNPTVKFLSRGSGHTLFLTPAEMVLGFAASTPRGDAAVLRMKLPGANARPRITGMEELPGKVNYFIGHDATQWRANVPTYAKVRYESVYPGVDLIYYGNQRQFEYDFVVAPGADVKAITLAFEGPDTLALDAQGDLVFQIGGGELRLRKPLVYQVVDGSRKSIAADYVLRSKDGVGIRVAAYDRTRPLIIDPVLVYSTYLGGNGADIPRGIAADPATPGIVYVAGETTSTNFPATAGSFQPTLSKGTDCFVAKFDTTQSGATSRVYATYLGGSGADQCYGVAVDDFHDAYVVGRTTSTNFPLATKLSGNNRGASDAIVVKLNASGSALLYSVYLGGSADEWGLAIAVDSLGQAYVTGRTTSTNFPVVGGFQTALGDPSGDAFVTKINRAGNAFVYSTYLGGNGSDQGQGVAADPVHAGIVYVTGDTASTNLPTKNGFQLTPGGTGDAFVTKVDTTATGPASLLYSTYLGGSGADHGGGIATDGVSAYVTGQTASSDLSAILSAPLSFDGQLAGLSDAFVARVDTSASGQASVPFFSYLGGNSDDSGNAIAVDTIGNVYVTGRTFGGFPITADAFQPMLGGASDAFVARLNTNANGPGALVFASYLGGSGADQGHGLVLDPSGDGYVTGATSSTSAPPPNSPFPTTPGGFQATYGGGTTDAFIARIVDIGKTADLSLTKTGPGSVNAGGQFAYTLSVSNAGPSTASAVTVSDLLPVGVTLVSASGNGWSCSGTTTVTCTLASLAVGAAPSIVLTVTAPAEGTTLANSASVRSATPDLGSANNTSATVQTTVVPRADLAITKTGPASVNAADQFAYTLSVSNLGPSTATSVTVSDALPAGATFVSVTPNGWSCSGTTTVTCTLASLTVGAAPSIVLAVQAPAEGTALANSAAVGSATSDPNGANNTSATVQTTVVPRADLAIAKIGPASVNAADQFAYTLSVSNAGPSTASAVTVSDLLPVGVTLVSASGNGWSCSGTTTVTCTLASLAVGAAPNIVLTVTAPAEGTTLANSAAVGAATSDPNGANNTSATVQTTVVPRADLSITKTGPTSVNASTLFAYTLSVSNAGPSTASAVTVSDLLPPGVALVSASGSGWSCGGTTTVTCALAGLAAGAAPDVVISVTAPAAGGPISNQASVISATPDPNAANNTSATVQTLVNGPPVFTVATLWQVNEGAPLSFQVTATDPGGNALTFSASNLPLGASFDPATQAFAWTPNSAQGGPSPYLVYFAASNGQFSSTATVKITVLDTLQDRDGDGVPDALDNCPDQYNPDQADVCHNSPETVTATSALSQSGSTQGPLNLTFTATLNGGANGTFFVPVNLFNTICRVSDAGGHELPVGAVPEGPPIALSPSPSGVLVFVPAGTSQDSPTTFDLKLFFPNLISGTYTVTCDYVNFAHIPQPEADDPTIWRGTAGAQSQTVIVGLYAFTGFGSPADHEPFNLGRTVPVKFSLIDSAGAFVTTATATLFVQQLDGQGNKVGDPFPATSSDGDSDNQFRYNFTNNQYIFNMSTKPLAVGLWQLVVKLDNGTTETIVIVLR